MHRRGADNLGTGVGKADADVDHISISAKGAGWSQKQVGASAWITTIAKAGFQPLDRSVWCAFTSLHAGPRSSADCASKPAILWLTEPARPSPSPLCEGGTGSRSSPRSRVRCPLTIRSHALSLCNSENVLACLGGSSTLGCMWSWGGLGVRWLDTWELQGPGGRLDVQELGLFML